MNASEKQKLSGFLDRLEANLDLLLEAVFEPDKLKARGLRRKFFVGTAAGALKARVHRAAKRHGMTYDEWVAKHGMVAKL